jgi:CRP/FNR family transcriptional regulator, cyclic AMP receptor protein
MPVQNSKLYPKGSVILCEGECSRDLYVLISGTLGVYKETRKIAEISEAGIIFGEMSELLEVPRTTTIVAEDAVVASRIQMSMDDIIRRYPDVAKKIMVEMAKRLATMNCHTTPFGNNFWDGSYFYYEIGGPKTVTQESVAG